MRSVAEIAVAFDRACRKAGVAYAFMGGVAVMAWGQPRATTDVDALVELPLFAVDRCAAALAEEGLGVDPADFRDAFKDGSRVTVHEPGSVFHVDVKLARTREERREIADAQDVPFGAGSLRVTSAEDTVAYKLVFGSEQDLKDARSIVVRQEGRLDLARLRALARGLGVEDALDDLLASAG